MNLPPLGAWGSSDKIVAILALGGVRGCAGVVSTRRNRISCQMQLTRCHMRLREKPAAAVVRAVAPFFYAARQRRRCPRDVDHPVSVKDGSLSAGGRTWPRRSRPGRLRDRLRSVSHRIRIRKSIEVGMASSVIDAGRGATDAGGDGATGPSANASPSSRQLLKSTRWVKKEFKVTDKLKKSLECALFNFKCSCMAEWMGPERYRGEYPLEERITRIFRNKNLLATEFYKEARRMANVLDDFVLRDDIPILSVLVSKGAEHLFRGLLGFELALAPVTSVETLVLARWHLAKALDLHTGSHNEPDSMKVVRAQATKRQRNRWRLKRLLKKWGKPHGFYFIHMCRKMRIEYDEEDLLHVCTELKITG